MPIKPELRWHYPIDWRHLSAWGRFERAGSRQTPTFFVNGRPLDPFGEAELRALVADEVAKSGG